MNKNKIIGALMIAPFAIIIAALAIAAWPLTLLIATFVLFIYGLNKLGVLD